MILLRILIFLAAIVFSPSIYAQAVIFAPVGLSGNIKNYNEANLTWQDDSDNETEFRILRRQAYYGVWAVIGTVPGNQLSRGGFFSYLDTKLSPGSYEYKINACNSSVCSGDSVIITLSFSRDTAAPSIPGSFTIAKDFTETSANLSWLASTDEFGIGSYKIYRSPSTTGNFSFVASVSGAQLTYSDNALSPATQYYYYVKAADLEGNESLPSAIANVTTLTVFGSGNFIRVMVPNGGECYNIGTNMPIRWTGTGINAAKVYYGDRSSSGIYFGNATSFDWYINASVSATTAGSVWVVAVDASGAETIYDVNDNPFTISYDCSKATSPQLSVPEVPSNFKADLIAEKNAVNLTWQDNSVVETEFQVFRRSLPDGKWQLIAKVGPNITSHTDYNLAPAIYEYDARACNLSSCSAYSNQFKITTQATLPVDISRTYVSSELNQGDMISAVGSNDPDIYIINEHGYKRLFLNPVIFGFYGHLGGFSRVKSTAPTTRDLYKTSGLFTNCETNDGKVYGIEVTGEDTGMLRWINITGEQAVAEDPDFFRKVFCINNNEFNWYTKGSEYNYLSQVPVYTR